MQLVESSKVQNTIGSGLCSQSFQTSFPLTNMKFYNLETKFTFGKYEGLTVEDVIDLEISYIEFCLYNLDHFYISDEVIAKILSLPIITEKMKVAIQYATALIRQRDSPDWDEPEPDYYCGYSSASEMAIGEAFEGDSDLWNDLFG
jgi:hypothetical protein